jgi:hypothetical protein
MRRNDQQLVAMTPRQAQLLLDMVQRTEPISLDEAVTRMHLISVLARADDAIETRSNR